ncbi:MAG: hypothetical protein H6R13_1015 [Proteobacteria bacterium]|nr:hypothetical protein [Pseudomonadota bacterium]
MPAGYFSWIRLVVVMGGDNLFLVQKPKKTRNTSDQMRRRPSGKGYANCIRLIVGNKSRRVSFFNCVAR